MHFTFPLIIAALASIATAAPVRSVEDADEHTHIIAPRNGEIQAHTLPTHVLQKRTPVGQSYKVWHPNDIDFWRTYNRHYMRYRLGEERAYRAQVEDKKKAAKVRKQKWETLHAQMDHGKASADVRMPKNAPGRSRGGKGGSNPRGGR
ncbi:hypothetical protein PspLS_09843 [Pyricularia sp. CBS 133598]|nr:hypothetical protein PspLS_09843 [Pyricularia sp. CBS 133598]